MFALGALGLATLILRRRLGWEAPAIPAGIALSAGFLAYLWQYWYEGAGGGS
jgi:hypothetical protein